MIADAPLDLAPLCAGLTELDSVELDLHAGVSGEHGLAALGALRFLRLRGDAECLNAVVAGFAWDQIGSPSGLDLVARGGAFVVDVTPLGALTSLESLVGEGLVLGPRDISGEAFAALLPSCLHALYSAHADESDKYDHFNYITDTAPGGDVLIVQHSTGYPYRKSYANYVYPRAHHDNPNF